MPWKVEIIDIKNNMGNYLWWFSPGQKEEENVQLENQNMETLNSLGRLWISRMVGVNNDITNSISQEHMTIDKNVWTTRIYVNDH